MAISSNFWGLLCILTVTEHWLDGLLMTSIDICFTSSHSPRRGSPISMKNTLRVKVLSYINGNLTKYTEGQVSRASHAEFVFIFKFVNTRFPPPSQNKWIRLSLFSSWRCHGDVCRSLAEVFVWKKHTNYKWCAHCWRIRERILQEISPEFSQPGHVSSD